MRSGVVGLVGVGLITSFVSALGIEIGVIKEYVGSTLVALPRGETYVVALVQEDVMYDSKEPV